MGGFSTADNSVSFAQPAILAPIQAQNAGTAAAGVGANKALQAQNNLLNALQGQRGIQNQSQVYGQLQNVAAGQGPNPARALLNQATGQNVATQAALMAGQRGSSANAGLIARQAAQQGAALQQGAVGQGAALQAQQSLGALGQAGQLATQQAGQQIGATGEATKAAEQEQALQNQALAQFNASQVQNQGNITAAQAGLQNTAMQGQQGLTSGILSGVGTGLMALLADGGDPADAASEAGMPPMQDPSVGGMAAPTTLQDMPVEGLPTEASINAATPQSIAGKFFKGVISGTTNYLNTHPLGTKPSFSAGAPAPVAAAPQGYLQGYLPGTAPLLKALGGETSVGSKLKQGGHVPGKPKVSGPVNSYENDTVSAKLSPGEIVIPRSVTKSSDPVGGAARFVQAVLDKKKGK